ncbi:SagB family peptide dehydrogenase [Ruegeria sp. SCP11]|uniref:SagB family peptide dehydrogenase n=1 Tax=Ruegeria sp. SCP11 TaxID=3141378 RepID=UPI003336144D
MDQPDIWAYGLAPDILLDEADQGVNLRSPSGSISITDRSEVTLARKLAQGGVSEAVLTACLAPNPDAADACAAFLFRLDQRGFLCRFVIQNSLAISVCVPQRAPETGLPTFKPRKTFRLSPQTLLQPEKKGFRALVPGSWATVNLLDPQIGPLLFKLSEGVEATQVTNCVPGLELHAFEALMRLFAWCDLLDGTAKTQPPMHEVLFHSHTRLGFTRTKLGKTGKPQTFRQAAKDIPDIALPLPNVADLIASDPPHFLVSRSRRSRRDQGRTPINLAQLNELLFRCFYQENGHRSYPSGGALYSLTTYLLVNRCDGLVPGLYAYDAASHGLTMVTKFTRALKGLLEDAAASANCASHTQILLLLSSDMAITRTAYGDLAYSLTLKEVGAVYQNVQLASEAMKLAACPLGTANSLAFAKVIRQNVYDTPLVGEMIIGSSE